MRCAVRLARLLLITLLLTDAHVTARSSTNNKRANRGGAAKDGGSFRMISKVLVPLGILSLPTVLGSSGLNILDHSTTSTVSGQQQQQQQQLQQQARMTFTNQASPGLISTGLSALFGNGDGSSLLSPDIPSGASVRAPRQPSGDTFGQIGSSGATVTTSPVGGATDGRLYRRLPGLLAQDPTATAVLAPNDQPPKISVSYKTRRPAEAKPLTRHAEEILGPQALAQQMAQSITPNEDKSFEKLPSGSVLTQLNSAADMLGLPSMNDLKVDGFNKILLDNLDNLKYRDPEALRKQLKLTNEPLVHFDMRTQRHLVDPMPGDDEAGVAQHVQPHPGAWANAKPYADVNLVAAEQQQRDALAQGVPFTD